MDKEVKSVFKAKLIRVVDGDTIDAQIDLGFDVFINKRIRLWGINAPERRSDDVHEVSTAKRALMRLASILALSGGEFYLVAHGSGKYGRCLGEIFVESMQESVNKVLISEGLAEEYKS